MCLACARRSSRHVIHGLISWGVFQLGLTKRLQAGKPAASQDSSISQCVVLRSTWAREKSTSPSGVASRWEMGRWEVGSMSRRDQGPELARGQACWGGCHPPTPEGNRYPDSYPPINYVISFLTCVSEILRKAFLPLLVSLRVVLGGFTSVTACISTATIFTAVGFSILWLCGIYPSTLLWRGIWGVSHWGY